MEQGMKRKIIQQVVIIIYPFNAGNSQKYTANNNTCKH